ncbi:MAG: tRNA lysidine(34) synthetase TilS [Bacteroidota bacterium]
MAGNILHKIVQTIEAHKLLADGEKVLVAISGGPDSVFLAWSLKELGYAIELAHVNYHLRGKDSDDETQLVKRLAEQWKIPVHIHHVDTPAELDKHSGSLQEFARKVRYDFFEELMEKRGIATCATAHHADDQSETLLMSLTRHNSPTLFKGIPIKRSPYIRPLLAIDKEEILQEVQSLALPYAIDASNASPKYLRNTFRLNVLPPLKEINPNLNSHLAERSSWYQQQLELLHTLLSPWLEQCITTRGAQRWLDWISFRVTYPEQNLEVFVAMVLEKWGLHGHVLWEALRLTDSMPGKQVHLLDGSILARTRSGLTQFYPPEAGSAIEISLIPDNREQAVILHDHRIQLQMTTDAPAFGDPNIHYLDVDKLVPPLVFRYWQQEDRMQPYGMKNEKKLSDIFIDEKYDLGQKARSPLICDQKGICLLAGFRIDHRVRVTPQTTTYLRIEISPDDTQAFF